MTVSDTLFFAFYLFSRAFATLHFHSFILSHQLPSQELRNIDEDFYTILTVQSCRRGLPLLPYPKRGEVQEEEVSDEPEPDF